MIPKNTRFGHLVVIGPAQPVQVVRGDRICNWSASWCRCDCGATKVVPDWRLRTRHITSCGCRKLAGLASARHTRVPRIGTRFGALTLTAHLPDRVDRHGVHHTRSEFTCACGRTVALDNARARRMGSAAACAHEGEAAGRERRPAQPRMLRLARPGARFGQLAVEGCRVEWAPWPAVYAAVRCDCGARFETWVENLRRGVVATCPKCRARTRAEERAGARCAGHGSRGRP